jgi:hypothetical protein
MCGKIYVLKLFRGKRHTQEEIDIGKDNFEVSKTVNPMKY